MASSGLITPPWGTPRGVSCRRPQMPHLWLALLPRPATAHRAGRGGHTEHETDGSHSSWPHDTVGVGAHVTFLLGVVGSDEHAPSLHSLHDTVEAGDLPSGTVMLSAPSAVLCPPPTSHRAPAWTSLHGAYTIPSAAVRSRPDEISPVPQMAVPAFRSPYAGGFLGLRSRFSARPLAFALG